MTLREEARAASMFDPVWNPTTPGDELGGEVLERSWYEGQHGGCAMLAVRATKPVRLDGETHDPGGTWRVFCGTAYLRSFVEDHDPQAHDFILLKLTELRPSRHDSPTKVISSAHKRKVADW